MPSSKHIISIYQTDLQQQQQQQQQTSQLLTLSDRSAPVYTLFGTKHETRNTATMTLWASVNCTHAPKDTKPDVSFSPTIQNSADADQLTGSRGRSWSMSFPPLNLNIR